MFALELHFKRERAAATAATREASATKGKASLKVAERIASPLLLEWVATATALVALGIVGIEAVVVLLAHF